MVSADRIDTPPLEASAEKMHLSMDDRDVLETSESKGPLYLQAAPGSTVSIHSHTSPIPSPTNSDTYLNRRYSGQSDRSLSACVCFRCKNSSRPSSISSSYDTSLTCACYKCEKEKNKSTNDDSSSRHSSYSHSDQIMSQPNMINKRQDLWDQENDDPVERFSSPVASTLDQITKELKYSRPSSILSKSRSRYSSYEDPEEAEEGLDEFQDLITREGSAQSLLEPVLRIRDTLNQQAMDSIDGMSSVADDTQSILPTASHQRKQMPTNNIPQPNIIPTRLSCLTAYYRNGAPHRALNMHQIKRIPNLRDRLKEYDMAYYDCIQARTELNAWLRKQEVKGPPDCMFEFQPTERRQPKRSLFGKKIRPSADLGKLSNYKKSKSTLSLVSVANVEAAPNVMKATSPTVTSPTKAKRWSGLFKGSPFAKKEEKDASSKGQSKAKRKSFYGNVNDSPLMSLEDSGQHNVRKGSHSRQMSEPAPIGHYDDIDHRPEQRRLTTNEEFELASRFDRWKLQERGVDVRTPFEEEDEEEDEDEIAYFTPDGRLSSSPAKHPQHSGLVSPDGDGNRPTSHSQISLLSIPSIGNHPYGRSRPGSESSHSHQTLEEHEYMDMEEALDNLSLNFRNIDTETLREILEEANGDYEQAVSLCKQAIFEGRL